MDLPEFTEKWLKNIDERVSLIFLDLHKDETHWIQSLPDIDHIGSTKGWLTRIDEQVPNKMSTSGSI